jgi:hypothetical protein
MRLFIFISFLLLIFSQCAKKPNYSKIPQIEYKSFYRISNDSANLTIKFFDGDGDIGGGPNGEGNFFIVYYFWNTSTNKYEVFKNTTFYQDSIDTRTFPAPSNTYKNSPISGEVSILMSPYRADDSIKKFKYSIFIKDNAGNKSNLIQTPDLYAP